MKAEKNNYKNISKKMKIRYIPAFIIILILIITRQFIIDYQIDLSKDTSKLINVAGRQRMLSQMIIKDVIILSNSNNKNEIIYYLNEIKMANKEWKTSQTNLQNRSTNSESILGLYAGIQPSHDLIFESANEIIKVLDSGGDAQNIISEELFTIEKNEVLFLDGMEEIVNQYDIESDEQIQDIENIERVLFWIIVIVILFVVFFIFTPSEKALKRAFDEINDSYIGMDKIFKTGQNILFLVNEVSFDIIMMSEEARNLLSKVKYDETKLNFTDSLNIDSIDNYILANKIRSQEKVTQMEIVVVNNDESQFFLLSSNKVKYLGENSILISLFDITIQKNVEETMRKLSIRDKLTGLYNRNFLDEIIEEEMARALRYNFQFSVFILDLDFFKKINDTWGHPVGDIILKETAELATGNLRRSDYLVRIGGEEFLLLMPHTNLKEAMNVAEKIRKEIEKIDHPIVGKYTASFGIAQWDKAESFKELYERADEALYKAKEKGRNRVVSSKKSQHIQTKDSIPLEWKKEWESGNQLIDSQHKELLDLANDFIFLSLPKSDALEPIQKIDDLIKHVSYHFECEEAILKESGYLGYLEHSRIHDKVKNDIEKLKIKYSKGEAKLSAFFTFMFDEVLIGHMLDEDVKFFPFVIKTKEESE